MVTTEPTPPCKSPSLPTAGDVVFILWNLEGEYRWWPATLLHISKKVRGSKSNVLAKGRVRYHPYMRYEEEEYDVKFIYSNRTGQMVEDTSGSRMSWRSQSEMAKPSEPEEVITISDSEEEEEYEPESCPILEMDDEICEPSISTLLETKKRPYNMSSPTPKSKTTESPPTPSDKSHSPIIELNRRKSPSEYPCTGVGLREKINRFEYDANQSIYVPNRRSKNRPYPSSGIGKREVFSRSNNCKHQPFQDVTNTMDSSSNSFSDSATKARRAQNKKKLAEEIKLRAEQKLNAMREREESEIKHRHEKEKAQENAEKKIQKWTLNGVFTTHGRIRMLLSTLNEVMYEDSNWDSSIPVESDKQIKLAYRKAILRVHPDKISSKNLPIEDLVLAELVFNELKKCYDTYSSNPSNSYPAYNHNSNQSSGFNSTNQSTFATSSPFTSTSYQYDSYFNSSNFGYS